MIALLIIALATGLGARSPRKTLKIKGRFGTVSQASANAIVRVQSVSLMFFSKAVTNAATKAGLHQLQAIAYTNFEALELCSRYWIT